jgi:hypothetical protein
VLRPREEARDLGIAGVERKNGSDVARSRATQGKPDGFRKILELSSYVHFQVII